MIKNQELAGQIFEMTNTAIEASEEMKKLIEDGEYTMFRQLGEDMYLLLKGIRSVSDELKKEETGLSLPAASESCIVSLARILKYAESNTEKAAKKLQYELTPLLEEMRINFYFWGMVYPDQTKMKKYYEEDIHWMGSNKYIAEAMRTGKYKYDLSIYVLGYNKVEYTKLCLEGLYKHLPKNITYEIILVNHGSNDGTKEVFEMYMPDKQLDIAANGGGVSAVTRIMEGRYFLYISNDVVITKNAIENMYKAITSDKRAAWVVPATSNIANMQVLPVTYSNFDEMEEFAEKNNQSDCYRWEQRVRLNDPIAMMKTEFREKTKEAYIYHSKEHMSFPDDRKSLLVRRCGYKMYLVKDAYCHHFGSVTLKEDKNINFHEAFRKGREDFIRAFRIDPWMASVCYSYELFSELECQNQGPVKVLGIECGLGSNPLKIKEQLKEKVHNVDCYVKNVLLDKRYYEDVKGVSDEAVLIDSYEVIKEYAEKYDYVICEKLLQAEDEFKVQLEICKSVIAEQGVIILLIENDFSILEDKNSCVNKEFKKVKVVPNKLGTLYPMGSKWVILSSQ